MGKFDLVSALHALPETAPIEIEGIQFGGGNNTCQAGCVSVLGIINTLNIVQTVCVIGVTQCQ